MADMTPLATTASMRDAVVNAAMSGTDPVELVVATLQERASLLNIAKLAFPSGGEWHKVAANTRHYRQAQSTFGGRGLVCVLAKLSGAIAGYIFYQPQSRKANESYIKEMGVSPAFQGKNIGTFLLAYVVGEAKDNGRSAIKLYTTNDGESKKGYYAKFGFAQVPDTDYDQEGYTTDDDAADKGSILMSGDVNHTAAVLAQRLKI